MVCFSQFVYGNQHLSVSSVAYKKITVFQNFQSTVSFFEQDSKIFSRPSLSGQLPMIDRHFMSFGSSVCVFIARAVFIITTSTTYCSYFTLVLFLYTETEKSKLILKRRCTIFLYKKVVFPAKAEYSQYFSVDLG